MLSLPNHQRRLSPFVLSLSKYERAYQPFQSLPFDKLPSTGSGQAGRTDWKVVFRKPKEIKNGLRTLFYILLCFLPFVMSMLRNPSALNLPNHRQHLPPVVVILPEHINSAYLRSY
ncbi:MAG: hypothetical protein LBD67_04990 [Candidatus Accumulibacter sp.]|jgi:hypothetical protein|nr:hypothetical protein [Accumulibacter sp.]